MELGVGTLATASLLETTVVNRFADYQTWQGWFSRRLHSRRVTLAPSRHQPHPNTRRTMRHPDPVAASRWAWWPARSPRWPCAPPGACPRGDGCRRGAWLPGIPDDGPPGGWPYLLDINHHECDRPGRPDTRRGPAPAQGPAARGPRSIPHERSRPAAAEGGEHRYSESPDRHRVSASTFSLPVAAVVVAAGMVDHDLVALADAMTLVNAVMAGPVLAAVVPR